MKKRVVFADDVGKVVEDVGHEGCLTSLKQKVIRSFLKFIERRERKQMVLRACEKHIQTIRAKAVIKAWQRFVGDQREDRQFHRHMYTRMERFKAR